MLTWCTCIFLGTCLHCFIWKVWCIFLVQCFHRCGCFFLFFLPFLFDLHFFRSSIFIQSGSESSDAESDGEQGIAPLDQPTISAYSYTPRPSTILSSSLLRKLGQGSVTPSEGHRSKTPAEWKQSQVAGMSLSGASTPRSGRSESDSGPHASSIWRSPSPQIHKTKHAASGYGSRGSSGKLDHGKGRYSAQRVRSGRGQNMRCQSGPSLSALAGELRKGLSVSERCLEGKLPEELSPRQEGATTPTKVVQSLSEYFQEREVLKKLTTRRQLQASEGSFGPGHHRESHPVETHIQNGWSQRCRSGRSQYSVVSGTESEVLLSPSQKMAQSLNQMHCKFAAAVMFESKSKFDREAEELELVSKFPAIPLPGFLILLPL